VSSYLSVSFHCSRLPSPLLLLLLERRIHSSDDTGANCDRTRRSAGRNIREHTILKYELSRIENKCKFCPGESSLSAVPLLTLVFRNERRLFLGGGGLDKVESAVSSFVAPSSSSSSCVTVGFSGKSFSLLIVGITMAFDRPQLLTYCIVRNNSINHCAVKRRSTKISSVIVKKPAARRKYIFVISGRTAVRRSRSSFGVTQIDEFIRDTLLKTADSFYYSIQ
jgi:hypothetical protein